MNLFRTRQGENIMNGQYAVSLKVRTGVRAGFSGGGAPGPSYPQSIPPTPYLPQAIGCSVPQKAYSDGYISGFNDSPRH
jgi:hypothetical protein